jgi:hypothetical protein
MLDPDDVKSAEVPHFLGLMPNTLVLRIEKIRTPHRNLLMDSGDIQQN